MATRRCCPECFDDRGLREQIFPFLGPERGTCSYCGTPDVDLLEPQALAPYFELVVNVYERSDGGQSLAEWMKEDWQLFSHPAMDIAHTKELLADILDDGDIVRASFVPSPSYKSEGLVQWETLRDESSSSASPAVRFPSASSLRDFRCRALPFRSTSRCSRAPASW